MMLDPVQIVVPWRVGEPAPLSACRLLVDEGCPLVLAVDRREGCSPVVLAQLFSYLSADESRRYSSYRRPSDAELFLLGRSLLRTLLALLLELKPPEVCIVTGPHGKPSCPGGPEFNVSQSGDLVLIAVHPTCAVGVDVEASPGPADWESISCRVLPADVCQAVYALPRERQPLAFLQAWCHLEAQLKMAGTGFHAAPVAYGDSTLLRQWALALPQGYVGSVAMEQS
jgi:4'-phosphopantetheinyl transferase